ncbi:MAG: hypothetical protein GWN86_20125 [Desulfobacterales bacterium]|nr:hypothetical protein [Desulfobacterales bacterium]
MVKKPVLAVLPVFTLLAAVFAVASSVSVAASSSMIHVPEDYGSIQEAVDAANPRDIILVSAGIYYEHVTVNKTVSLLGENHKTTIIDGNNRSDIILNVTANNVKISGFTIQNAGGLANPTSCGVFLDGCNGTTIHGNTIASNLAGGILMIGSAGNMIINNHILDNGGGVPSLRYGWGIMLANSTGNIFFNNTISNNEVLGIGLSSSDDNIVKYNTFTNNSEGVGISSSTRNVISENVMTLNENSIYVHANGNTIERNQVTKNKIGISLGESKRNVIRENWVTENTIHGIVIAETATKITVVRNTISNNLNGIKIHYSNGSIIHHNNFINNTRNSPGDVYPNVNTWDNGYPSGGNYWSDYNGTDLYNGADQNLTGSDGIGDTPRILDPLNRDNYPLIAPTTTFNIGNWNQTSHNIHISSNSTITNLQINKTQRRISFNVSGPDHTAGFCRTTIPNVVVESLWQNNYSILIDGKQPSTTGNWTDATNTLIHFTYNHTQHKVTIVTEFPATAILPLVIATILCSALLRRKMKT